MKPRESSSERIVPLAALAVSVAVGLGAPYISIQGAERSEREAFERERVRSDLVDLRAVSARAATSLVAADSAITEAFVRTGPGRRTPRAVGVLRGELAQDIRKMHRSRSELRIRLGARHPIVMAYFEAAEAAWSLNGILGLELEFRGASPSSRAKMRDLLNPEDQLSAFSRAESRFFSSSYKVLRSRVG
jgi:hypothetical protein